MVEEPKSHGLILHNHIFGNTLPIPDDFIATGAETLEIDHKTDAAAIKQAARGKTTLLGNLDTNLLHSNSPADVEQTARQAINLTAPDGGFMPGPVCAMDRDSPDENIHVLIEAAKKYEYD